MCWSLSSKAWPGRFAQFAGCLLGTLVLGLTGCGSGGPTEPLARAQAAADKGDLEQAREIALTISRDADNWPEAQVFLGGVENSLHGAGAALPYFEAIPRDDSTIALRAAEAMAEIRLIHGDLFKASADFEYVISRRPEAALYHGRLAHIQGMCGLNRLAGAHLLEVIKRSRVEIKDLVALTDPDRPANHTALLQQFLASYPDDPYLNLGLAFAELEKQDIASARKRVEAILQSHPQLVPAQALLGELALDGDLADLQAWHAQLPPEADLHPDIWYVRGQWARRIQQNPVAARCFWEAVRLSPVHRRAMFQLGQVTAAIDKTASAAFTLRAEQLKASSELMEQVLIHEGKDQAAFRKLVALLLDMGRDWEAWGWVTLARDIMGPHGWPATLVESMAYVPGEDPPRFRADKDVALLHDLSHLPGFETLQHPERAVPGKDVSQANVRFTDQAEELGVAFTYYQSPDSRSNAVRIFESTGGGVGVLDFDHDGWPDLFFTQGEDWPAGKEVPAPSDRHRDQLYRNTQAGFREVTDLAGLNREDGFGQGCSCGDFDNDGFVDLYVANIGVNQLLINNGDGTFTAVTLISGITGAAWTTSCLIADLNADGLPDLYDVNYLQGERLFSVECSAERCSVRNYEGAPDHVLLSQGDGTFVTVPDATPVKNAKGLGIIALFPTPGDQPSLFIANDQVPNFFLRPVSGDGRYADAALEAGLACNRDGQPTACMGVAAGDLNHDRSPDLFVTNFSGEANTLYLQREPGLFEDMIVGSGLLRAGIPYVGWGTQFLDADNDRELDLVVANGHIADFGEAGVEYHMPLQFFRNRGQGQFQQLEPAQLGPLFEARRLGRSLAVLDWNRDGLTDFVVSNIEAPVIIATNQTQQAGRSLNIRLHARLTAREALGATVEIEQAGQQQWQQLLAGDGYQVTNERQLHFGLGDADAVERLTVHWPSGGTSQLAGLPADATVEVYEGLTTATLWRGPHVSAWPALP